eukprot:427844-Prorocentrum_minimum.AAC.2
MHRVVAQEFQCLLSYHRVGYACERSDGDRGRDGRKHIYQRRAQYRLRRFVDVRCGFGTVVGQRKSPILTTVPVEVDINHTCFNARHIYRGRHATLQHEYKPAYIVYLATIHQAS